MIKGLIEKELDGLVARAYNFAKKAHKGQKRKTGEEYISHCVATAERLVAWGLPEECIAAGLLHDVLEDTPVTVEEMRQEFGEEVIFLVESVSKLGKVKYQGGEEAQAENLRKMMLALGKDIRVILIKLADRWHNMETLSALPPLKQKRIALETMNIYAPLAYRLGMHQLSGKLEDLSFPYLYPKEHERINKIVKEKYGERERYLNRAKPILEEALKKSEIKPRVINFRAKHYFSLYKKLERYEMNLDRIYDLVAFRIIVETIEECYAALGVLHGLWKPLPGRIKDYIALPKPNGYRSLHTTVFCLNNMITEFQIRTEEMHEEAEHGIAAHWIYKNGVEGQSHKLLLNKVREATWIKQLKEWDRESADSKKFAENMKIELFRDRIFVITPEGEVEDLPEAATPVDFAYRIHSQLGNEAIGAKVNGRMVPLDYKLESGDMVEILRQKGKMPSSDWLKFVKTPSARDHIKEAMNKKERRFRNRV